MKKFPVRFEVLTEFAVKTTDNCDMERDFAFHLHGRRISRLAKQPVVGEPIGDGALNRAQRGLCWHSMNSSRGKAGSLFFLWNPTFEHRVEKNRIWPHSESVQSSPYILFASFQHEFHIVIYCHSTLSNTLVFAVVLIWRCFPSKPKHFSNPVCVFHIYIYKWASKGIICSLFTVFTENGNVLWVKLHDCPDDIRQFKETFLRPTWHSSWCVKKKSCALSEIAGISVILHLLSLENVCLTESICFNWTMESGFLISSLSDTDVLPAFRSQTPSVHVEPTK